MRLPAGAPTSVVRVFLSSGDNVLGLRDLTTDLVNDAVNAALRKVGLPLLFDVDRWERTAPHRVARGETPNADFVARAKQAHVVVCMLIDDLGEGTREEIEAVLDEDDVELAVLWCVSRSDEWPDTAAGAWLGARKQQLFIDRAGELGTDGPTIAITRLLIEAVLRAMLRPEHRLVYEQRSAPK